MRDGLGLHAAETRGGQRRHERIRHRLPVAESTARRASSSGPPERRQRLDGRRRAGRARRRDAVGGGQAEDQRVGQVAGRMATPHHLPVQQAGPAVAEVGVAGMGVAVQHGVRARVDDLGRAPGSSPTGSGPTRSGRCVRSASLPADIRISAGVSRLAGSSDGAVEPAECASAAWLSRATCPRRCRAAGASTSISSCHLVEGERVQRVGKLARRGRHVLQHDDVASGHRVETPTRTTVERRRRACGAS